MSENDELLKILREAAQSSPNNISLQKQFADLLLKSHEYAEAETVYRHILDLEPNNDSVKFALAQAFFHQSKEAISLVIMERLLTLPQAPGEWYLLAARAYWQTEQTQQARTMYRQALQRSPALTDAAFAAELGIPTTANSETSVEQTDFSDTAVRLPIKMPTSPLISEIEQSEISFKDVGGMEKLKEEIRLKIIYPLQQPEIYQAYGKSIGGGILMYGPPGCGKTHLARATAGEVNASFLSVGLHDVLDMYLGQSEHNLHELFELARRHAPCVLFFDEVDALGANRADMRRSAGRQLINQFLSELDGIEQANEGVLVLAATNAPWHLDPAFRRPGRFDRVIFVPPPDTAARAAILQLMLQNKPSDGIGFGELANKTIGFSGADLKGLVDTAVELKLQEALQKGIPTPIKQKELLGAVKKVKSSTIEWFNSARNYALYANQGGLYDDVLDYIKTAENRSLSSRLTFWKDT